MKREILRGLSMLMLLVTLAFVTAVVSANGQTPGPITGNVPFEFAVGDHDMPAGQIEVRELSAAGRVLGIATRDRRASTVLLAMDLPAKPKNTQAKLVFHRYGQRYFLAEVWNGSEGKQLKTSKRERAIEREYATIIQADECGPQATRELARNRYATVEILAEAH
ncbi:MAG: hypothetical protein ABI967_01240 [bacterium]